MIGGKSKVEIVIAAKDRTKAAFAKVNTQMKTMKASSGRLTGAMNSLKGGLSNVSSSLGSFGAALGPIGIAVAAAAVVMATLGGAAIKASLEFEKAVATIRVGTGATGDALAGLESSFKTVFTAVPASTANVATAIADLNTRLGLTGEPLEALATQFLNLSRITGTDVAASISSATRVMHDFAVSSEDQAQSLDYLFKVSQSTGIGMTNLANNMTRYGGVMRQMGFDINTSAALLGKFEKEGVNLELVLSSLRMGLANFARAGEEPVEALKRVISEIQGMGSAADRNLKAIEIFGARSGPDMAAAIYEGRFSIEELMATLDASGETINKAAADTLTFGDTWTLFKNKVMTAIAPIGDVITNVLCNAIEGLSAHFSLLQSVISTVMGIFKGFFDAINSAVSSALAPLIAKVEELRNKFKEGSEKLTIFSDIITIVAAAAKWLGEKIGILIKMALTPLVDKLEDAIEMLTAFYDKLGPIKTLIEGAKGAFGKVAEGIHNMAVSLEETKKPAEELEKAIEDVGKAAKDAIEPIIEETEKAIEKQKEFTVTIGDTTIEFKGAAAEVVKNADAYEKLQKSAQTLIDLDWSVFTEFEASLPRIDAGIGDMESSFVGLKGVLEDNIDKLENIQKAIIDINEIAAPFLEAGFLEGVKAIGDFAGALKDAGSAIGDFSSLQDVSIDGCINFSLHVRDMVTALEILESQMEDLVPSFAEMDLLIGGIMESFVWVPGKKETLADEINRIAHAAMDGSGDIAELRDILIETTKRTVTGFRGEFALPYLNRYKSGVEEAEDITNDFLASEEVLERQVGYTTEALKFQTGQLKKITDALQPYLEFMRTLNELAALSTLSTDELNKGLNSINDTLINLGTALSSFDLRSAMEGLFAPDTGSAKGFMDVMGDYNTDFLLFASTLTRITEVIGILSVAMENAAGMVVTSSKDMEAAMRLIPAQLEEIETFLRTDLWGQIVAMLFAVNVEWKNFEDILETTSFSKLISTISNLIGLMDSMKGTFADVGEQVVISASEIETAMSKVDDQLEELETYLMTASWDRIVALIFAVGVQWQKDAEIIDDYMPSFNAAVDTISTLASKVLSLSSSLIELRDMSVLSVRDIDEALKNIPVFLDRFVDALALNMGAIKQSLKDLDKEWALHTEEMKAVMPSYEDSTAAIGKLIGSLVSLQSALKSLSEIGTISEQAFDRGFNALMESISNFAVSLSNNVDDLIFSLQKLRVVWIANEDVLVPLMRDFAIITDNLWGVAHNANRMAEEFSNISKNAGTLERGFKSLIEFINQVVKSTKEFYTTEAAAELAGFITDVGKVIDAFVNLEKELKGAMDRIKGAITTAVDNIAGKISSLSTLSISAFWWGVNMMKSFISGIKIMSPALALAVMAQAAIVKAFLGASSPTKLGPLSHLDEWPRNLIQSYSAGIEAEMHTLNSSFAGLAPGMNVSGAGGGNRSIVINNTQYINSREDADYANRGLERMLSRHSVM